MVEIESTVLPLHGAVEIERIAEPVVGGAARLELLGAKRVRDVLDGVVEAVGEVVRRVDAPLVAGARMMRVLDAIGDRILLAVLHGVLHAQRDLALVVLAPPHVVEQAQRLVNRSVAPRRRRRIVALDLVGLLVAHVRLAALDQLDGQLVQAVELVGRVRDLVGLVAEPVDHLDDALEVLLLLLLRIRVVEAQVAVAIVFLCSKQNNNRKQKNISFYKLKH